MQEIDNRDFDLKVRDMLSDAEMRPSRSVWSTVSARVNPVVAPAPAHYGRFAWAGVSAFAVAAAVALAVFVPKPGSPEPVSSPYEASAVRISDEEQDVAETILTNNNNDPAPVVRTVRHSDLVAEVAVSSSAETGAEEGDEVPCPETEALAGEDSAADVAAGREGSSFRKADADLFAQMEWEDSHASVPNAKAVVLSGMLGANNADSQGIYGGGFAVDGDGSGLLAGITETGESMYGLPLSVGAGFRYYLNSRLSLGAGLQYSMLTRSFNGSYVEKPGVPASITNGQVLHTVQYIGIPVGVYYDVLNTGDFLFYVYGNAAAEYAFSNKYMIRGSNGTASFSEKVDGLQYSVGTGVGVEFRLTKNLGLYLDPSARYYFDNGQPRSIRTARPLMLGFEVGLRFDLNRQR